MDNERHCLEVERGERDLRSKSAVERLVSWPISEYVGTFEPTAEERYLHELASEYHERTEDYDRTVCTGPVVRNAIRPANGREFTAINKNAQKVRKELQDRAMRERGIPHGLVTKAIQHYRAS